MPHVPVVATVSADVAPRPRAPHRARRVLLAVLVVVVGVLAGTTAVGLDAAPAAAATRCGGAVPGGHIRVVVVVDSGVSAANATCLVVPEGTTGAQLWAHRAAVLGTARPRYADSGLLCAFDGYPASGCGTPSGDGYLYWSYWSGTSGSWVYGGGNPHVRRVRDGDIEGWRFVSGPDGGQNPPPRLAPSRSLFPPLPAPTTQPPPPPPTAAPAPAPNPGSPGSPAPGATPSAPSGSPVSPDGLGDPSAPRATIVDPETGATVDAATGEVVAPTEEDSAADETTTTSAGDDGDGAPPGTELAADTSAADPGGPGAGVGVLVAVVLIVAIGGAGILRARAQR